MTLASVTRTPAGATTRAAVAAAAAAVAGGIHLWVMPEHLVVSLTVGVFFLVVGCAQLVLGAVLVVEPPGPRAMAGIAVAHLGLIALYVASRTHDLPFAPFHAMGGHVDPEAAAAAAPGGVGNGIPVYPGSRIEPVGALDLVCVLAEVVLVALLVGGLSRRARTVVVDAALALGVGLLLLRVWG
ncbi:MAG: hypothetical protein ACXWDM_06345 [Nocardioides sp.]